MDVSHARKNEGHIWTIMKQHDTQKKNTRVGVAKKMEKKGKT